MADKFNKTGTYFAFWADKATHVFYDPNYWNFHFFTEIYLFSNI